MAKGKEFLTNLVIGGKVSPSLAKAINKANEQSKVLKKIGNLGKAIGKATLATSTAAAAGIVAISKSAVESYAEYEQLVGGSQLMFGDAYSYIADKAKTAYKDVQMSQNEYLQQVNGFATGLKTALGGNEQLAAELSHKIIKAEADVVAATGNTAENVQNAFNGIMKSNFTMLDNLQLGITPTKQGFQDLINKVNKWNAQNGKLTKYTINNLADCQSALVDYIEMQGLAGYASNEASGTIQGSLAMTKASWQDLLTGLADGNANFDALLSNFLESVGTLGKNLLPKISIIIGKIPDLVEGIIPLIPPLVAEILPVVIDGVMSIISGVGEVLPELIGVVVGAIGQIITESFSKMPTPMLIIAGAIAAVTAGIAAYNAVVAIKNIVDKIQETGIKKLVAAQLAQNAAFLASPIFWIIAGIVALIAIFVVLWNKCEGFRNFWIGLWKGIKTAGKAVIDWLMEKFKKLGELWDKFKSFFGFGGDSKSGSATVKAYATGGTVTRPHLAVVGDAPETIVPHSNTPRNRALLTEAARGVGVGLGNNVTITFAPVISGGSGAEVRQAIRDSEDEFEQRMDAYFKKKGRVSFA